MLELFHGSVLWKVLTNFLSHPSTSIYVKQLSRKLELSPSGTHCALKKLADSEILLKEEMGKAHYYALNNALPFVKVLKTSYFLAWSQDWEIEKKFNEKDKSYISLILYGSYASGEYDEKSDVDLLLISLKSKDHFLSLLQKMETDLNKEVSLEVFSIAQWHKMKKENTIYYQEVKQNHILLSGNDLL